MKRFHVIIRWRAFKWTLYGIARSGCDLICGLADHFPQDSKITVRRTS